MRCERVVSDVPAVAREDAQSTRGAPLALRTATPVLDTGRRRIPHPVQDTSGYADEDPKRPVDARCSSHELENQRHRERAADETKRGSERLPPPRTKAFRKYRIAEAPAVDVGSIRIPK